MSDGRCDTVFQAARDVRPTAERPERLRQQTGAFVDASIGRPQADGDGDGLASQRVGWLVQETDGSLLNVDD